jgi:hypothetical protein
VAGGAPWSADVAAIEVRELHLDGLLEHLLIEHEAELARAELAQLAEHDVLRYALELVALRERRSVVEDVHCLLEGAPHERAGVVAVDAVARDGHHVTAVGHDLRQDSQVAVVHVRPVELDHVAELAQERVARRLDAQHLDHLAQVV